MNKSGVPYSLARVLCGARPWYAACRNICTENLSEKAAEEYYKVLKIPLNSEQDVVREAFLRLAKKYHPDSGSPEASIDKFVSIEKAFRVLSKINTGSSSKKEVEKIVYDIRHTAPQHRQYLSYEGVGYGNPFQRQKQWQQARAQKAAENVMEHRVNKSLATNVNTLINKGQGYEKKHDIKTKYGFDRLVEDLIQESISKGEFDNLSGKGKPLKNQNNNPYVDFTTHKINEVLINNGFTPEWIMMGKEIDQDILALQEEIKKDRSKLGPYPLSPEDQVKWQRLYELNKELAGSINSKINTYNIMVPLMQKQKFHVAFDKICEEILKFGPYSDGSGAQIEKEVSKVRTKNPDFDFIGMILKAIGELFTVWKKKKNIDN